MFRAGALTALLLLASCGTGTPKIPHVLPNPVIEEIIQAEDGRTAGAPIFARVTVSSDPAIRARAALALGRILAPEGIDPLMALSKDADSSVRRTAIFAMGQYGFDADGAAGREGELLAAVRPALEDPDENLRAAAIEAVGKLAFEKAPAIVIPILKDKSSTVRCMAAVASFRWRHVLRLRQPDLKPEIPESLLNALVEAASDADPGVRWRAAWALRRFEDPRPVPVLFAKNITKDSHPWTRVFALMLLERTKLAAFAPAAAEAQKDPVSLVRQAAVRALDALNKPDLLEKTLVMDPSHHVREAYADALAAEGPELEALAKDASPAVRAAALLARVRIRKEKAMPDLEAAVAGRDPVLRVAAFKALGDLKTEPALELILKARGDGDEEVRAAALVPLANFEDEKSLVSIVEGLKARGIAERGTAIESLGSRKEPAVISAMVECYRNSLEREWVEMRESIVDALAARPPDSTTLFLLDVARSDPAPSVRKRAVAALRSRKIANLPAVAAAPSTRTPYFNYRMTSDPTVILETTKGTIEIECFAREAPIHVANFVGLVERGYYDGLKWHRVVPNFVIQGGDPLGNGWGDPGWSLRAEVNDIPYARGTLGMPRSSGFDTGGCQIFITHLPTPHLDGLYTVFGRVVRGLETVDSIEVGDRILRATLKR
ncbi:MAG TPA: HEAT repeat domain-containing protein [Planctomycetota bacterium]